MELFPDLVSMLTDSPVLPLIVLAVCIIDGFFPPVPSEMTVVAALAALLADASSPVWVTVIVGAAASGAIIGDSIAFAAGRHIGTDRFGWMRTPRVRRTTAWISDRVQTSPATIVLVGRFVPAGRVAVNATAGASALRFRRFLVLSTIGGTIWACTCLALAWASAAWLADPVWSALLAVVMMLALGFGIDHLSRRSLRSAA